MKKTLLAACLVLGTAALSFGQNDQYKFGLGIHTGTHTYHGELGNETYSFDRVHPSFGVSLSTRFGKAFGLGLELGHGVIDHRKRIDVNGVELRQGDHFRASMNHVNAQLRYHLDNGSILSEDVAFKPFLFTGLGFNHIYKSPTHADWLSKEPKTVFNFPLGLGVNYDLSSRFMLQLKSSWNFMGTDMADNKERDGQKEFNNDQFMYHNFGVIYNFGGGNGDKDGDGVLNRDDECKDIPGPMENKGCPWPDADNDGVPDIDDKCPETPGTLKGCPDSDEDGIQDDKDQCPNEKGTKATKGCPDADKDGVKDSEDECKDVYGLKKFKGCPDSDGDGIIDSKDKCPNEAGEADREGCPAPKQKGLDTIYFNFNSTALTAEARKQLNAVATSIKEGEFKSIEISGHTDNVGSDAINKKISQKRADVVKSYLVKKGIKADMFEVVYYGSAKPLESNETEKGRSKNRRTQVLGKY